ncbi:MAG: BPSS1780 family membrane protein [Methylococcales bacterium]
MSIGTDMQPKRAQTGALAWYRLGWQWFTTNPMTWVLLIVAYFAILMALQLLPVFGSLIGAVLWPGLSAGLLYASKKSSEGTVIRVTDLFSALLYSNNRSGLLNLGMISLAVALVSGLAIYSIGGEELMSALNQSNPSNMSDESIALMEAQLPMLLSIMLVISAITAVFFMYAVPLVAFKGVPAFAAIKASISTSLINFIPLWLFGSLYLIFAMLASLPMMLGFLILMPVTICAWYASYLDIFGQDTETDITTIV